jgi:hypothetical protein
VRRTIGFFFCRKRRLCRLKFFFAIRGFVEVVLLNGGESEVSLSAIEGVAVDVVHAMAFGERLMEVEHFVFEFSIGASSARRMVVA